MDAMKIRKPFKVDKNGTQYFADYTCPRCGGAGGADAWKFTGWTCYECGGTGKASKPTIFKEYTEEYRAKLDERRRKRQEKKDAERRAQADELNKAFCERMGYGLDGMTWCYLGNTYDIKDTLKEQGAKYNGLLGWHSAEKIDGYDAVQVKVVFNTDLCGVIYAADIPETTDAFKAAKAHWYEESSKGSAYVGAIGDRIEKEVTLLKKITFETQFGYMYISIMKDNDGNVLVWKGSTSLYLKKGQYDYKSIKEGERCTIRGTVKAHGDYNGTPQTELTRCKVIA